MPLPLLPYTLEEPVDPVGATVLDLDLEVGSAHGSARTRPGTYPVPEDAPGWVARVVDRAGNLISELPFANVKTVVKTLNAEDEIGLESPKTHPSTKEIRRLRELQVYRNEDLKSWGVITGRSGGSNTGARTFNARGLWWYFRKRFFGTASRTNMLSNGNFETGPATGALNRTVPGWTRVGGARLRHWTAATKPGGHGLPAPLRGTKAISLDSPVPGLNRYVRSRFSYRTDFPPGQRVTFAAWVYIGDGWIGPAALGLGLYVSRVVAGETTDQAFVPLDEGTPRGEWVRLETSLIVRPRLDGYIEVRLYSPGGWVVWDESVAVLMESTGAGFAGADQTALASTIVTYGQTGRGKSPLGIGTSTPATGVIRRRAWQHAAHEWLDNAMNEISNFPDGFDYSIEITPRTRTFVTHFPRKGTDRSADFTLRLGRLPDLLAGYSESEDAAAVVTAMIARGKGDGPDREEGAAVDTSDVGGLVLDGFVEAPEDLLIGELDDFAEGELEVRKEPVQVLEVKLHPRASITVDGHEVLLLDLLETGDLVSVEIDDGDLEVDAVYRIIRIAIDCPTDVASLTLNRWTS